MTVDEAQAKGIDVSTLEAKDGPTDPVSPVGTAPSHGGVAALEEKMENLKTTDTAMTDMPLPNGSGPDGKSCQSKADNSLRQCA